MHIFKREILQQGNAPDIPGFVVIALIGSDHHGIRLVQRNRMINCNRVCDPPLQIQKINNICLSTFRFFSCQHGAHFGDKVKRLYGPHLPRAHQLQYLQDLLRMLFIRFIA